jgi:hypothetical protein
MTVKALFHTWTALKDMLHDPYLCEDQSDLLADQSMEIIVAMTNTPSAGLMDVLLKLEIYGREVEAGPCAECDALLGSALRERTMILAQLGKPGVAASARDEHGPWPPLERRGSHDQRSPYPQYRGEDPRSSHP